ncbi:spermidine synthase [Allorhizocola rhizosphaerae]|uniref:spermidine synthase n=1 Tax=Allorhizocola rhizosphaerae TaxID=1872709 RepID=UPI000E3CFD22|nr:fused MFS/spermidine synthase [Allorhizocola rhizosphaerae]
MRIRADIDTGVAELYPDPDVEGAWTLLINGVAQSHVDLNDPEMIAFDYVRRMADIMDSLMPQGPLEVLHLGGGAMTLPRCVAVLRPGSLQRVVELDRALLSLVLEYLPLDGSSLVETVVGDAALHLAALPEGSYDVVVSDVFQGANIPSQVSTLDFLRSARRVLRPDGLYVANIMDTPPLDFARGQAALLREVFAQVAVVADAGVLRGRRHGNLLLVGAGAGLPFARMARRLAADPFAVRIEQGDRLARWIR